MIHAFSPTILVTATGKVAQHQSTPRRALNEFLLAKVKDNKIEAYTSHTHPDGQTIHFQKADQTLDPLFEVELKDRYLPPSDFMQQYPLCEVIQDVEAGILSRYPSSSAALSGLGALAILARRERGMLELATLEKPEDYFDALKIAIQYDPSLTDVAVRCAPTIAEHLYRSKAQSGLTEQIDNTCCPIYKEPYRSIYLEGLNTYLRNGGPDVSLDWVVITQSKNDHAGKVLPVLVDYFAAGKGCEIEAHFLPDELLKHLISNNVQLKTSDIYAATALEKDNFAPMMIRAGYDWRLSPSLAKFHNGDSIQKGADWAQEMLKIFKGKDLNNSDFWGLNGAEDSAKGRDILSAIKAGDPAGFNKILSNLPRWAKMGCLALGVLSIHEVENVPSVGRDKSMSRDLGL